MDNETRDFEAIARAHDDLFNRVADTIHRVGEALSNTQAGNVGLDSFAVIAKEAMNGTDRFLALQAQAQVLLEVEGLLDRYADLIEEGEPPSAP